MVSTVTHVHDNGDLELPPRPRRRLELPIRLSRRRSPMAPEFTGQLRLSRVIA